MSAMVRAQPASKSRSCMRASLMIEISYLSWSETPRGCHPTQPGLRSLLTGQRHLTISRVMWLDHGDCDGNREMGFRATKGHRKTSETPNSRAVRVHGREYQARDDGPLLRPGPNRQHELQASRILY